MYLLQPQLTREQLAWLRRLSINEIKDALKLRGIAHQKLREKPLLRGFLHLCIIHENMGISLQDTAGEVEEEQVDLDQLRIDMLEAANEQLAKQLKAAENDLAASEAAFKNHMHDCTLSRTRTPTKASSSKRLLQALTFGGRRSSTGGSMLDEPVDPLVLELNKERASKAKLQLQVDELHQDLEQRDKELGELRSEITAYHSVTTSQKKDIREVRRGGVGLQHMHTVLAPSLLQNFKLA